MKNIEKPSSMHLQRLVDEIGKGSFVIPDFQRDFEWHQNDVIALLQSIFMDYYIGTPLLWKAGTDNIKKLSCEPIYGFEGGMGDAQHIVLDGQQRFTALHYAFFSPKKNFPNKQNRYFFFARIEELLAENYEEAFFYDYDKRSIRELLDNETVQFRQKVLPLNLVGKRYGVMDWLRNYKEFWLKEGASENEVTEEVNQLDEMYRELFDQYSLSYIELDREIDIAKVCEIFTKINNKGMPLDIFDLLNAVLRKHDIFLKDKWRSVKDKLDEEYASKMKIYILQVMSILIQGYCSPKYLYYIVPHEKRTIREGSEKRSVIQVKDGEQFETMWDEAVKALEKAVSLLKNQRNFAAIKPKFLPYQGIIPALAAITRYVEKEKLPNALDAKRKINKWYWASVFQQSYSSAVETQAKKDYDDLRKWFTDETAKPEAVMLFERDYKNLNLYKQEKYGAALYNAIFNILILEGAKDWTTLDYPEYSELDDHHIVPASWGKKHRIDSSINSILNKTPLSKETNRHVIRDQLPNVYMKEMIKHNGRDHVLSILKTHLISEQALDILLREPFTKDDYEEFLEERNRTMLKAIFKHCIALGEEESVAVDYGSLIADGESESVEFKETLSFNVHTEEKDQRMEHAIARSIAAFLNSNGGTLCIGVNDKGEVLGLERDYELLTRKQDKDGFQLHLRSVINRYLDSSCGSNLTITIPIIEGKEICIVEVQPSNRPVYLKDGDKKEFYYRSGSVSQALDVEESNKYINSHWE